MYPFFLEVEWEPNEGKKRSKYPSKILYTNVKGSFICNCQKLETTQMIGNRWQRVVYPYI